MYKRQVICRENRFGPGYFAKLAVKALNGIGGINQPPDFLRNLETGAQIRPVVLPGGRNLRVFLCLLYTSTCNAIAPGFIETDMTAALPEKVREASIASIPMKRMGRPEEIAALVCFLCREPAGYLTGEAIRIDGGLAI